ncbi:hypothetical protein K501DRAFT_266458 [Backusella circina FSU 941]|nr:hypothetical protein K501DRAFT_266458 [Backusella circina FSU 941]
MIFKLGVTIAPLQLDRPMDLNEYVPFSSKTEFPIRAITLEPLIQQCVNRIRLDCYIGRENTVVSGQRIHEVDMNIRVSFEGVKCFVDGPTSGASFESSMLMLDMTNRFIIFDPVVSFSGWSILILLFQAYLNIVRIIVVWMILVHLIPFQNERRWKGIYYMTPHRSKEALDCHQPI